MMSMVDVEVNTTLPPRAQGLERQESVIRLQIPFEAAVRNDWSKKKETPPNKASPQEHKGREVHGLPPVD